MLAHLLQTNELTIIYWGRECMLAHLLQTNELFYCFRNQKHKVLFPQHMDNFHCQPKSTKSLEK